MNRLGISILDNNKYNKKIIGKNVVKVIVTKNFLIKEEVVIKENNILKWKDYLNHAALYLFEKMRHI
jgi:hypothetical protein